MNKIYEQNYFMNKINFVCWLLLQGAQVKGGLDTMPDLSDVGVRQDTWLCKTQPSGITFWYDSQTKHNDERDDGRTHGDETMDGKL